MRIFSQLPAYASALSGLFTGNTSLSYGNDTVTTVSASNQSQPPSAWRDALSFVNLKQLMTRGEPPGGDLNDEQKQQAFNTCEGERKVVEAHIRRLIGEFNTATTTLKSQTKALRACREENFSAPSPTAHADHPTKAIVKRKHMMRWKTRTCQQVLDFKKTEESNWEAEVEAGDRALDAVSNELKACNKAKKHEARSEQEDGALQGCDLEAAKHWGEGVEKHLGQCHVDLKAAEDKLFENSRLLFDCWRGPSLAAARVAPDTTALDQCNNDKEGLNKTLAQCHADSNCAGDLSAVQYQLNQTNQTLSQSQQNATMLVHDLKACNSNLLTLETSSASCNGTKKKLDYCNDLNGALNQQNLELGKNFTAEQAKANSFKEQYDLVNGQLTECQKRYDGENNSTRYEHGVECSEVRGKGGEIEKELTEKKEEVHRLNKKVDDRDAEIHTLNERLLNMTTVIQNHDGAKKEFCRWAGNAPGQTGAVDCTPIAGALGA